MRAWKDHPRGCGEHAGLALGDLWMQGSSPRMRGALHHILDVLRMHRIIPADAGSTTAATVGQTAAGDHPRGCGEHSLTQETVFPSRGSSPRMRGAPADGTARDGSNGIIPADAGSTHFHPSSGSD